MDVTAYLERINYRGSIEPTGETLRFLQIEHLLTVPFENLSIHAGEPIVLDEEILFDKIVRRRRGGFCYEANGMFAALLCELGFKVEMLSARVARADGSFGSEFDHLTLRVEIGENDFLADVGFGDSFLEPLRLNFQNEQTQGSWSYLIKKEGEELTLLQRKPNEDWMPQYIFTLKPYQFSDFAGMCRYHQTSPNSHFTKQLVCSRATTNGRITLTDSRFIETIKEEKHERMLNGKDEFRKLLQEHFGIVLNETQLSAIFGRDGKHNANV
ncbi:MAG: arylamine N-acetyltransferase [Acidobacteriota bacterium]|nr:arylamine N-acetyltransferase [Acidobacteriota bacterium]